MCLSITPLIQPNQSILLAKLEIGLKTKVVIITLVALSCLALIVGTLSLLSFQSTMAPLFFHGFNGIGFVGSISFISTGTVSGLLTIILAYIIITRKKIGKASENIVSSNEDRAVISPPPTSCEISSQKSSFAQSDKQKTKESEKIQHLKTLHLSKAPQEDTLTVNNLNQLTHDLSLIFNNTEETNKYNVMSSGRSVVFTTPSYPEYVFKYKKNSSLKESLAYVREYLRMTKLGQQICRENDLNLLLVPPAIALKVGNRWLIVQKRVNIQGGYEYQKGIYKSYLENSDLKSYTLALFKQIALFILLMGMKDVKYDNLPITDEGYTALIDLDQDAKANPMEGLYTSCAKVSLEDGLFRMVPLEYLSEIAIFLKNKTDKFQQAVFNEKLEEIHRYSLSAEKIRKDYQSYLSQHRISSPRQTLRKEKLEKLSVDEVKIKTLAVAIIEYLNKSLDEDGENPDLVCGREKFIHVPSFYNHFVVDQPYLEYTEFQLKLEKALLLLKNESCQLYNFELTEDKEFYNLRCGI